MSTLTGFDPVAAGFRVAEPIKRRKRRPSSRTAPKPQYADAVLYSFKNGQPLEVSVRTSAVEDTVRRLKRAARYQERTTGEEVRVQISVEAYTDAELAEDPKLRNKSRVKFLGHSPYMLGRRISKARAEELGATEPEAPAPAPARHRRTVAARRPQHARTALRHAMVRAVITAGAPPSDPGRGFVVFTGQKPLRRCHGTDRFFSLTTRVSWEVFALGTGGWFMEYYREYIEVADPDDGGPPYTAEVRLCHDFPVIKPTGGNQVVVFDERVPMSVAFACSDEPADTETFGVLATA